MAGSIVNSPYLSGLTCPGRQRGSERLDIITVLRHGSMYQVYSWATLTRSAGRPWNHKLQNHHASSSPVFHLHDEADANWHQPVAFFDERVLMPPALAMIQPWHPGLMYLMYCAFTEEEMLQHRSTSQPIPAGRLEQREENADEAILEVHLTLCIYTKMQNLGSACHTVHLHKKP